MNDNNRIPPRIQVILAKEAPVAAIIARFRAKLFHVMRWDIASNAIEHGSWFHGKLYEERCDLSFDGRHMVYFALGPSKRAFAWTAVCEPPRLSALAWWEHPDTWYGGGYFLDARTLWVHVVEGQEMKNATRHVPGKNIEKLYTVRYATADPLESPSFIKRMARDGWDGEKTGTYERAFRKRSPGGNLILHRKDWYKDAQPVTTYTMMAVDEKPALDSIIDDRVTWADWDARGRLLVARDGLVVAAAADGTATALVDLGAMHVPGGRATTGRGSNY